MAVQARCHHIFPRSVHDEETETWVFSVVTSHNLRSRRPTLTVSYTEHTNAIALDPNVAIFDSDLAALGGGAGDYAGASVTLARIGGANAEDQFSALASSHLSFTGGNAILSGVTVGTVSNSGGILNIAFSDGATQAQINEVLSSIAYANSSSGPSNTAQIGWTFSDGNTGGAQGAGGAIAATSTTTVNVVYAAPVTPIDPIPPIPPAPITPVTIAASTPLSAQTATEGTAAIATYHLSGALGAATEISARVDGQGGATSADWGALYFRPGGVNSTENWVAVTNNKVTLASGITDFELKVDVLNDTFTEGYESAAFVVAQTSDNLAIASSWYVASVIKLADPGAPGSNAPITPVTIAASTPLPAQTVTEGTAAIATYHLSSALGTSTDIHALVEGWGGASAADYGALYYRPGGTDSTAAWTAVTGDMVTLVSGITDFELKVDVVNDALPEAYERVNFVVAQTANSVGITNSWYVASDIVLADVNPFATITESTPLPAQTVTEGTAAIATYHLSSALGTSTDIHALVEGWGGASAADYGALYYRPGGTDSTAAWTAVTGDMVTLVSGITDFELKVDVVNDALPEAYERVNFVVAQTASSVGITGSWYVASDIELLDVITLVGSPG